MALRAHGFSWGGSVVLYGFKDAVCPNPVPDGNGSPGCPGAERTELKSFVVR